MENIIMPERLEWEIPAGKIEEVAYKKWLSKEQVLEMLKNNETKDGVSILGLLYAFQFYSVT